MNSEEIKEIGQLFLNFQNNNGSGQVGLTDEEVDTYVKELSIVHAKVKSLKDEILQVQRLATQTEENLITEINNRKKKEDKKDSAHWSAGESKEGVSRFAKIYGSFGGVNKHLKNLDSQLSLINNDTEAFQNKLRKDYRELQSEMWERLNLIETWIQADNSTAKERIRGEIMDNIKEASRQEIGSSATATSRDNHDIKPLIVKNKSENEQYKSKFLEKVKKQEAEKVLETKTLDEKMRDAAKLLPELLVDDDIKEKEKELNPKGAKINLSPEEVANMKISHLELSTRTINCLEGANIVRIKDLLDRSPRQLLKIRYFGRICLRELEQVLIKMDPPLCLNFEPEDRMRTPSRSKLERIADRILGR